MVSFSKVGLQDRISNRYLFDKAFIEWGQIHIELYAFWREVKKIQHIF